MGKNLLVGVIEHGFKEATDRSLIFVGDASVLLDYFCFDRAQTVRYDAASANHIDQVNSKCRDPSQVGCIWISDTPLVAALSVSVYPTWHR